MKYHILTLFPEMIEQGLHTSILGRAINNGYISLETTNIRDFSANKFNRVDDYPYGGGAGMVMEAEPVFRAYQSVAEKIGKKPRMPIFGRASRLLFLRFFTQLIEHNHGPNGSRQPDGLFRQR